jgi:hypothetical protein
LADKNHRANFNTFSSQILRACVPADAFRVTNELSRVMYGQGTVQVDISAETESTRSDASEVQHDQ